MIELHIDLRKLRLYTIRVIKGKYRRFELTFFSESDAARTTIVVPGEMQASLAWFVEHMELDERFMLIGHAMRSITDKDEAIAALKGDLDRKLAWRDE